MDLSSTEETIIGLLRGDAGIDFTMNVAWIGGTWSVTLSDHGGAVAGAGLTFCDAVLAAFGLTAEAGGGEVVPIKPSLAIVGGTDHTIAPASRPPGDGPAAAWPKTAAAGVLTPWTEPAPAPRSSAGRGAPSER